MESLNIFRHVLKAHPCGKDLIYQSGINNVDIALGVTSSPCRSENSRSITLLHVEVFLSRAVTGSWAAPELQAPCCLLLAIYKVQKTHVKATRLLTKIKT